jgi:SpoVK/Ycf46/Vps4 family AAA+-type ATPase
LRDLNGKLKRVKDDISSKTIEIENINMGANFASGNNGGNIANAFTNSNGTVIDSKVAANMARLNAETDKKKNMINLSFMLNLLDGVLETPGRMMIITSNYPDKLDDAILRPGRIDIKIQFKRASVQVICDMLAHFYNMNPDDFKSEISANFDEIFTPAEIMDVCSNNYTDYKNAINELKNKLC